MKDIKKYLLTFGLIFMIPSLLAESNNDSEIDLIGSTWQLIKNGSHSPSFGSGQVVYFLLLSMEVNIIFNVLLCKMYCI